MTAAFFAFSGARLVRPLAIIVAASIGISIFDPSFFRHSTSDPLACGVGELRDRNVADGHHRHRPDESVYRRNRGLSAICFAGLMQVWGYSAGSSPPRRVSRSRRRGSHQRLPDRAHGISAFIITLASLSIFKGADLA